MPPAYLYVLEADICNYFDAIMRSLLMEMVGRRIGDGSILRLIGKWLNVGVIDQARLLVTETGTGQGQVMSPLVANIYPHYVLDEWFEKEVKPRLRGEAYEVRYADDFILCFEYREHAEKVLEVLAKRFAKYGLRLHPEKTRLIEFGREALFRSEQGDTGRPATFDFLGFTHICRRSRRGKFTVHVRTMRKRLRRSLKAVSTWCQEHRHDGVEEQCERLNAKLRGHYQYYGRPTNYRSLWRFYRSVRRIWKKWLNRRTRGTTLNWAKFAHLLERFPLLCPFAEVPGEQHAIAGCDIEVDERSRVTEPRPVVRGEIARAMFYVQQTYGMPIYPRQGELLLRWHRADPPDAEERRRNDAIAKIQGRRNPFIDDPGQADRLRFEAPRR